MPSRVVREILPRELTVTQARTAGRGPIGTVAIARGATLGEQLAALHYRWGKFKRGEQRQPDHFLLSGTAKTNKHLVVILPLASFLFAQDGSTGANWP